MWEEEWSVERGEMSLTKERGRVWGQKGDDGVSEGRRGAVNKVERDLMKGRVEEGGEGVEKSVAVGGG